MSNPMLPDVDVQTLKKMRDAGESFVLLDVREPSEIETAAIEGSVRIPMQQIPSRIDELEPHRDQRIVVQCHHGGRSARVAAWLHQQGFTQVQNLAGGIDAWSLEVDPTVPRY